MALGAAEPPVGFSERLVPALGLMAEALEVTFGEEASNDLGPSPEPPPNKPPKSDDRLAMNFS